jgi:hypothetical protein
MNSNLFLQFMLLMTNSIISIYTYDTVKKYNSIVLDTRFKNLYYTSNNLYLKTNIINVTKNNNTNNTNSKNNKELFIKLRNDNSTLSLTSKHDIYTFCK